MSGDTRIQPPKPPERSSQIDLSTLAIAAAASAVAAYVTSKLWPAGALWSAAASPVIVALVKEGLARPAERLQTVRMTRTAPRDVDVTPDLAEQLDEGGGELGPVTVHGSSGRRRRRWRLAVLTGVVAFGLVAAIYTVPELLAGKSLGAGDRKTTLFGGQPRGTPNQTPDDRDNDADPAATPTPGATATPTPGATPTPDPAASPTPTASPADPALPDVVPTP